MFVKICFVINKKKAREFSGIYIVIKKIGQAIVVGIDGHRYLKSNDYFVISLKNPKK
jgi:hypothetical protein